MTGCCMDATIEEFHPRFLGKWFVNPLGPNMPDDIMLNSPKLYM